MAIRRPGTPTPPVSITRPVSFAIAGMIIVNEKSGSPGAMCTGVARALSVVPAVLPATYHRDVPSMVLEMTRTR